MKNFYYLIILFTFALIGIIPTKAQQLSEVRTTSERIPVIIRMKQQFDAPAYSQRKLAGYSTENKRSQLMSSLKSFGLQTQKSILSILKAEETRGEVSNIKQFWLTNIISCEVTDSIIEKLKAREDVESVIFDLKEKIFDYGMVTENKSVLKANQDIAPSISMVRASEANKYGYTGKGVIVGLIDTGVNANHEDIKNALWTTSDYPNHGWNFTDNNNNTNDDDGHGSHCAGTILGNGKSGLRTGVAPDAKLMVLRVTESDGSNMQSITLKAIEFATEHGANVLSMSLGFRQTTNEQKKIWRDAMTNLLEFNILAVVAAGNEGASLSTTSVPYNIRIPASCPAAWIHPEQTEKGGTSSVITIGSVNEGGITKAASASIGPVTWQNIESYNDYPYNPGMGLIKPDISAPGENILSLTNKNNTGYTSKSGTSMATPCVAGIVATMLSKNPQLTPAEIVQIISESSVKISPNFNNQTGAGRADALLATLYTPNVDLNCTKITIDETSGIKNGYLNYGDEADLTFSYDSKLSGDLSDYQIEVIGLSPQVNLEMNAAQLPSLKAGTKTDIIKKYHLKLLPKVDTLIDLAVIIRKGDKIWTNLFRLPVSKPRLDKGAIQLKELQGNENGIAEAGEKIEFAFPVINIGTEPCRKVKVEVDNQSPFFTFPEVNNIRFEEIVDSESVILECNIDGDTPKWYNSLLGLKFIGDNIDTTLYYRVDVGKQAILMVDKTDNKFSSKAVATYLGKKNISSYSVEDNVTTDIKSLKTNHSIWIFAGLNSVAGILTAEENQVLTEYLEEGGNLYIEGGSFWRDETNTIYEKFNIKYDKHNDDQLSTIVGCVPGYNEKFSRQYMRIAKEVDHLIPIEPAYAFYKNKSPEFITTVAYDAGKYRTIGSSFELSGVLSGTENNSILNSYLDFFQIMKMTTGIEDVKQNNKLSVSCYKSENDYLIQISIPGSQPATVCLYNSSGQLINKIKENISGNTTICIPNNQNKGIYFITVNVGEETIAKKILF